MSDVSLFLFDFDGVVADTAEDLADAVAETQIHYGMEPMATEEILSFVGFGASFLIRSSMAGLEEEKLDEALAYYRAYYKEHAVVKTTLYPGVRETLQRIRAAGGVSCIISNKPEPITRKMVVELDIAEYFLEVIGPESLKHMKPDPEGLVDCMKKAGRGPKETIMIGDSYTDIQAGRAAGTLTCGVLYGIGDRQKLLDEQADFYVDNLIHLLEKLTEAS